MLKKWLAYTQHILPKQLLTKALGSLAESKNPWLKNLLIDQFSQFYNISLVEAAEENPHAYETFNDFFIRSLKPSARPMAKNANSIISPADGKIAQIARIQKNQLLQVKEFYFDLETLLGDATLAKDFYDGDFTTIYLAPNNYHRVHMPMTGRLLRTIYIPGSLFSVNQITSEVIPNLYSRNERLVSIFATEAGPMAVILVGAMIVGSMKTVWQTHPIRSNRMMSEDMDQREIAKGDELGYFKLGSTVVVLFGKNKIKWNDNLQMGSPIKFGEEIGAITSTR